MRAVRREPGPGSVRWLIVNADDLGASPGLSRDIERAHRRGIVSSASLMVNLSGFEEGLRVAERNPGLGVGLHINWLRGRSLLEGRPFPPLSAARLASLFASSTAISRARDEMYAQAERFTERLGSPTHIDSEKHLHTLPGILPHVIELARELEVAWVRCPLESFRLRPPGISLRDGGVRRAAAVSLMAAPAKLRLTACGLLTPTAFCGIAYGGRWNRAALESVVARLPNGLTELICHPAGDHSELPALGFRDLESRRRELQLFSGSGLRDLLDACQVRLTHFGAWRPT